jgi:hypothetical protein
VVKCVLILVVGRVLTAVVGALRDLLQQVVLVLTHHDLAFLLSLLKLVFKRLSVDSHPSICHYLLPCVAGDARTDTELHRSDTDIQREQVVLQVDDLHVWLGNRHTCVFFVQIMRACRLARHLCVLRF